MTTPDLTETEQFIATNFGMAALDAARRLAEEAKRHPLREALEAIIKGRATVPMDWPISEEESDALLCISRLVEACIAWESAKAPTGHGGVGMSYQRLMAAIRCAEEGEG